MLYCTLRFLKSYSMNILYLALYVEIKIEIKNSHFVKK